MALIAGTALIAFLASALLGKKLVPWLHKLKFGQTILDEGPAWHKKKQGTPTMGGIMFIIGMLLAVAVALLVNDAFLPTKVIGDSLLTGKNTLMLVRLFMGLIMAVLTGAIGFVDDYIKIVKKRNLGLTSKQKLLLQIMVAAIYAVSVYLAGGDKVYVPILGNVDFGLWFIPFTVLVIVGATNATNLTDGIDGLCGTVSVVASLILLICAGFLGFYGQSIAIAAFAGALIGFLVWNIHPAKVFMGDTGSLFIGGALCAFAFGIGRPLLLLPVGIVYIFETLSVILQVAYFKLTHGKRLFKMSPLHHHFEMCGFSENQIVSTFSVVGIIGGIIAILFIVL